MTNSEPVREDLEQHEIAAELLFGLFKMTVEHPGTVDVEGAAALLMAAAEERHRQGDYGAARVLDEWVQALGQPLDDSDE